MVKLRVQFEDKKELDEILNKLGSSIKKYKISKEKKGNHYNAYVDYEST